MPMILLLGTRYVLLSYQIIEKWINWSDERFFFMSYNHWNETKMNIYSSEESNITLVFIHQAKNWSSCPCVFSLSNRLCVYVYL